MKKTTLISVACTSCVLSYAQNVGIGTTNPAAKLQVVGSGATTFYAQNNGASGYGIVGEAHGAGMFAIRGISAAGVGVYGQSTTGIAVEGYGNDAGSVAVYGNALAGTGVKAYSYTGKGLEVIGNVSISGGNTNPSSGAVLTSDALGNAVWKNNKIGFAARSTVSQTISDETIAVITFDQNPFDPGNDFNTNSAAADKNTFIVPVSGFYHLDASFEAQLYSVTTNITDATVYLNVNNTIVDVQSGGGANVSAVYSFIPIAYSTNIHLNAGDKVTLSIRANNILSLDEKVFGAHFSGYLAFAD